MTTPEPQRGTRISLTFPNGVYSGAALGRPEELPSPARVHEAFVAAASGGPHARIDGHVLVAETGHRHALQWLEEHAPLAVVAPLTKMTVRRARRYRWRASPQVTTDTPFEPMSALAGPVAYLWPQAPAAVMEALRVIAGEVTHVGRADSVVIARVDDGPIDLDEPGVMRLARGRGAGRVMSVAGPGRAEALIDAHAHATRPGRHPKARLGNQVPDELVTGANETSLRLCRYASEPSAFTWPYSEIWTLALNSGGSAEPFAPSERVAAAVGIHRALIRGLGTDVPAFVTGRDGAGPLRGPGHLAIHITERAGVQRVLLALPRDVMEADRRRLEQVVHRSLRARARDGAGDRWFTVSGPPEVQSAATFWPEGGQLLRTEVPLVLEATGGPRQGGWTLEDATLCSIGYALRGLLEADGFGWGTGWAFRRTLVDHLRKRGVTAQARRINGRAGAYLHRADPGTLVVAAHALVELGDIAGDRTPWLALGRSRHLGGGLLRPVIA